MRQRDRCSILLEPLEMELDRLTDQAKDFLFGVRRGHTSRKVGHMGAIGGCAFLNDYQVSHDYSFGFFRPACFKALFNVPGGISTLG